MLKVAVVGCGAIADAHAWAIQSAQDCKLIAACDSEPLMTKQFCERFGVAGAFTELTRMLDEARPDVVHILTPPQSHFLIGEKCLKHGSHVFMEKPFTLIPNETEKLLALAAEKKLKVTVGHDALFTPAAIEARQWVDNGYLGGVPLHMESYYGYEFGNTYGNALLTDKQHWVRKLPGKLLHNIISHGIARVAEYISGDKPQVIALGFVSPLLQEFGEDEITDELRVIIRDEKGVTAYFTFSSQMRPTVNQLRVFGPENGIFMDEIQQLVIRLNGHRYKSYAEKFIPSIGYSRQYLGNFFRNVRLFLGNNFHVESGKKHLVKSFYRAITEGAPDPIPYDKIRLTGWIMDQIFQQIDIGATNCHPKAEPSTVLQP
jgi:predicted dehydrogenase